MMSLVMAMGAFLALLPLVDRRAPAASPRSRWPHFVVASGIATAVLALTLVPIFQDLGDAGLAEQNALAERDASRAFRLAEKGIPPGGAGELYLNDPPERGKRRLLAQCRDCHKLGRTGGGSAPDLTGNHRVSPRRDEGPHPTAILRPHEGHRHAGDLRRAGGDRQAGKVSAVPGRRRTRR